MLVKFLMHLGDGLRGFSDYGAVGGFDCLRFLFIFRSKEKAISYQLSAISYQLSAIRPLDTYNSRFTTHDSCTHLLLSYFLTLSQLPLSWNHKTIKYAKCNFLVRNPI